MDNTSFCASPEAAFVSSAEEAASEPAAWLPAAVVSVVDAPPQAVSIIAVQSLSLIHIFQTKTGKALNEAPTNKDVTFTEEESKDMTYGDKAAKVKVVDYAFVNPILNNWIDQWNRTINN